MVYIPYMTVLYMVYNPQQTCEAGVLGRHLASRAIKQLNEHITTAVLNTGRRYNT